MNERIGKLAEQALNYAEKNQSADIPQHWFKLHTEKFAELIIQECTEVTADWYKNHNQYHMPPDEHIKAHFGVEE